MGMWSKDLLAYGIRLVMLDIGCILCGKVFNVKLMIGFQRNNWSQAKRVKSLVLRNSSGFERKIEQHIFAGQHGI